MIRKIIFEHLMGILYYIDSYLALLLSATVRSDSHIDIPLRYLPYLLFALTVIFLVIWLQARMIRTKKLLSEKEQALDLVDRQRQELELKGKNITDSLVYAQRIQEALLPSEEYFRQHFGDAFILFKPKDIVSGDFYWIGEKNDKKFVVAADCTGHGVPGALMSVIGHDIIEKAINEHDLGKPSEILAELNKGLEKTFSREKNIGTIIRDGMDVGLCVIDKKAKKLVYAGAFFPLYIIRDESLIEIKADKLIIGMNPSGIGYTDNEFDLMDGDIIYLFSDGYVDQFGGKENKKFMYRRFRYLLLNIHKFPFPDQKAILEENIKNWMGNSVQVDDILIIGFKPLS